jgi:hypothetical protein
MVPNVGIRGVAITVVISPAVALIIEIAGPVDISGGTDVEKIAEDSASVAGLDREAGWRRVERCDWSAVCGRAGNDAESD